MNAALMLLYAAAPLIIAIAGLFAWKLLYIRQRSITVEEGIAVAAIIFCSSGPLFFFGLLWLMWLTRGNLGS
jgi:hypothetical protein